MKKISTKYKYAVIAADTVIFTIEGSKLKVLLIKMNKSPYIGSWAAPGGIIKPEESLDEAAKRVLFEKTGVKNVYLDQLYAFGNVGRDPFGRVVSVAYYALLPDTKIKIKTTAEHREIKWYDVDSLPKLAYDHKEVIKKAIKRMQKKLDSTDMVSSLLPEKFTLSQLQSTHEIILNKKLDKRNFRKKILAMDVIAKTSNYETDVKNRPALLYKFK